MPLKKNCFDSFLFTLCGPLILHIENASHLLMHDERMYKGHTQGMNTK